MAADPTDPDLPLPGAAPFTAYARFWRRYVVFTGRASLSEYWWVVLISTVIAAVLGILGAVLLGVGGGLASQGAAAAAIPNAIGGVLLFALVVFALAQIVPGIALAVRRLHDANLSGLLYLLVLIPSVGGLIVLVLHLLPSNPAGRRYDAGAPPWDRSDRPVAPAAQPLPMPPSAAQAGNGGFDRWPAPETAGPATAQLPTVPADTADAPGDALVDAWRAVGETQRVEPRLSAQPSWRKQGYLLVRRPDGVEVLTTNGLSDAEGAAALGPGGEVYLAAGSLGATPEEVAGGWRFTVVAAVARRIGASGMNLPAELEQYGALSMAVPADAPAEWRTAEGTVGVLIGVGLPGVPEAVPTSAGEVRLVGLVPLRPEELQRILDGGRDARLTIAGRLAALPPAQLVAADRPAV